MRDRQRETNPARILEMLSENFLCLFPSWWHHGQGKWQHRFTAHRLSCVSFPCFKYSLPQKRYFCLLSDHRQLSVLNYATRHVWEERRMVDGENIEKKTEAEKWCRLKSGRETWQAVVPPSAPFRKTLKHYRQHLSPLQWRSGWPALHDNYPCRNLLSPPSSAHGKQEKAEEACFCLRWWLRSLTSFCCCDSIWISKSMTLKCCDIFKSTNQLWGTKCKYFKQHGEIEIWQKEGSEWLWR